MTSENNIVELMLGFPDFKAREFNMEVYNQRFRNNNCIISAKSNEIYYDKHWGCLSLKFSIGGNENYRTGNSIHTVNDSNFLILNQDTEYSSYIDSGSEVESFTLNFSEKYNNSFLATLTAKTEHLLENTFLRNNQFPLFVERLYPKDIWIWPIASGIYNRLGNFYEISDEVTELFAELFCAMLHHHKSIQVEIENINKAKPSTRQELYRRLNHAKDFIDSCYNEAINLDTISQVACLNREYFIRQFKNYFKITPVQYLMHKRMDTAKHLLQTSEMSITEVCQQVGYFDLSTFGKLFRRIYNVSPTVFNADSNKQSLLTRSQCKTIDNWIK